MTNAGADGKIKDEDLVVEYERRKHDIAARVRERITEAQNIAGKRLGAPAVERDQRVAEAQRVFQNVSSRLGNEQRRAEAEAVGGVRAAFAIRFKEAENAYAEAKRQAYAAMDAFCKEAEAALVAASAEADAERQKAEAALDAWRKMEAIRIASSAASSVEGAGAT